MLSRGIFNTPDGLLEYSVKFDNKYEDSEGAVYGSALVNVTTLVRTILTLKFLM